MYFFLLLLIPPRFLSLPPTPVHPLLPSFSTLAQMLDSMSFELLDLATARLGNDDGAAAAAAQLMASVAAFGSVGEVVLILSSKLGACVPMVRALPITGSSWIRYGLDGGSAHHRTESCKGNGKKKRKKKRRKEKKEKKERAGREIQKS